MTTEEMRLEARRILGVAFAKGQFKTTLFEQDRAGRVGQKQVMQLLALLFQAVEDFEDLE